MLNVRDLEQQWLKYKIKSYYPHLFAALAILITVVGFIIYLDHDTTKKITLAPAPNKKIVTEQNNIHVNTALAVETNSTVQLNSIKKSKKSEPIVETKIAQKQIVSDVTTPKRLTPSFSFLNLIDTSTTSTQQQKKQNRKTVIPTIKPASEEVLKTEETIPKAPEQVVAKNMPQQKTPTGIKINRVKTQKEIQDIIRRFKENKNPALGLYLSRYYYKIQNYQKSYNYALNTNQIDKNIEESWLIFASSQVKLKKKDAAIKTLIVYIKHTDSINAKNLLHSIRNGDFK